MEDLEVQYLQVQTTTGYDEPEIVALPTVTGSAAYLNWMREETGPAGEALR